MQLRFAPRTEANYLVRSSKFYSSLIVTFLVLCLIKWLAPSTIPFSLFQFFTFNWDWAKFKDIPWGLLLVMPVLAVIGVALTRNTYRENREIMATFKDRAVTSILAGIFEEVQFRWIAFYYAIFLFTVDQFLINWLTGLGYIHTIQSLNWFVAALAIVGLNVIGFIGYAISTEKKTGCFWSTVGFIAFGLALLLDIAFILLILRWFYTAVWFPVVNWLTLGKFSDIFAMAWPVGAAMISVNGQFSKGHLYQGIIGLIHSWVIGMLMFWFVFNFGILAAMLIHAIFDLVMDTIRTSDAFVELLTGKYKTG